MEFIKWFGGPPDFYLQLETLMVFDLWPKAKNYQYTAFDLALLPAQCRNGR